MASSSASYVILSVDGNIGSGKSTLVKALKEYYNSISNENKNEVNDNEELNGKTEEKVENKEENKQKSDSSRK